MAALSASAAASCDHGSVDQTNVKSIASGADFLVFGTSLGLVRNSSMQCTGGSVKYTYDPPGTAPVPGVEYSLAVQASLIVLQSYNASAPTYTPCAAPNLSSNPTVFITGLGHEDDCRPWATPGTSVMAFAVAPTSHASTDPLAQSCSGSSPAVLELASWAPASGASSVWDLSLWPAEAPLAGTLLASASQVTPCAIATNTTSPQSLWLRADLNQWLTDYTPETFSPYRPTNFVDTAPFIAVIMLIASVVISVGAWVGRQLWMTHFSPRARRRRERMQQRQELAMEAAREHLRQIEDRRQGPEAGDGNGAQEPHLD